MSVNMSLILINCKCDRRKEDNSLLDESDKSIVFINLHWNAFLLLYPDSESIQNV